MRLGAKYQRVGGKTGIPFECVYVTDTSKLGCCSPVVAVLKWPGGAEFGVDRDDWKNYEEVIEPHHEFFNCHKIARETRFIGPYKTRLLADEFPFWNGWPRHGVLELIHHSETRVESVFHMVKK